MRGIAKALGVGLVAVICSAHIGSPDVFFRGRAGAYDVNVVVRPPEVVPGVASVTVRTGADVQRVSIRPVFWRAGSKGAPSADEAQRLQGDSGTFAGSLWLMARGAYSVDVVVEGSRGRANVLVPVASVATGNLEMDAGLGAVLMLLGVALCAGLVTIVYKAAGESLLDARDRLDAIQRRRARRVAAISVPVLALGLFGGARWWGAVDRDYERNIYRPSPLSLQLTGNELRLAITDTLFQPPRRVSALIPDHGKLMHLFLVRTGDATAFAHLHPRALDTSAVPGFAVALPPLPTGEYHVYGDVVHETGFERTTVGTLTLRAADRTGVSGTADGDDAWFTGAASSTGRTPLPDGSFMELALVPGAPIVARREQTLRVSVKDASGGIVPVEPYLGMPAHGVVTHLDGKVYVHLHPMGTVTMAAQDAFIARDHGDTTDAGRLRTDPHAVHAAAPAAPPTPGVIEFPYAFPRAGDYRLFVQVRRSGRVLTGAFAIPVVEGRAEEK
jgi:hypothetical protein